MPFHLAAFQSSSLMTASATEQDVGAVTDTYFSLSGTRLYLGKEYRIIAAYAGGGAEGTGTTPSVTRARIFTPSLTPLLAGLVRPLSANITGSAGSMAIPNDPLSVMPMLHAPLRVGPEELGFKVVIGTSQSGADRAVGLVWLADPPDFSLPAAVGGMGAFWVRFTTSIAGATAFNVWQSGALTLDQNLPGGQYAVIGMDFSAAIQPSGGTAAANNAIAARLIFNTQTMRPGVVAQNTIAYRNHPMFYDGRLGVWGVFSNTSPPGIEVLCATATATGAEGYLQLLKVA